VENSLGLLGDGSTNERTASPCMKVITFNSKAYVKVKMARIVPTAQKFFPPKNQKCFAKNSATWL
jgi:hypothetical protein